MLSMKKPLARRLIALAVLLAIAMPCLLAETHYMPRISIGARAGVSMSRMDITPKFPQSLNNGTCGALTFRYTEEKLFGLIAEIGWSQRGWKENFEDKGSPLEYSRTLTYLTLPILTHIYFGTRRFKCFINLGPEVAYMISSSIKTNFDIENPTADPNWPIRPRQTAQLTMPVHNKIDYGITGGIGFEFFVQPRHSVTLEGRYYFGLGNIFPGSKADHFAASRCTSIEVSLGYNFRLR